MFRLVSSVVLILICSHSWAERELLTGALGLWLKDTAAPELVEILGNHPKFKGERIRFMTLNDGEPVEPGNRLNDAVQQQLTHHILRAGKNDVAWQSVNPTCAHISKQAPYVVGIEIKATGRYKHRVNLAILDIEEAVWVGGVSMTWKGRLLDAETRALADPVANTPSGTLLNPIPMDRRNRLVDAIQSQVLCALPHGLEGTVHLQIAEDPKLQLIMSEFERRLSWLATISTAATDTSAEWLMQANISPAGFKTHALTVNLTPRDNAAAAQRIAAIYVSGADLQVVANRQNDKSKTRQRALTDTQPRRLLSRLRHAQAGTDCKTRPNKPCIDLTFDLRTDAHLLVFRTSNGTVQPTSCTRSSTHRAHGEHHYRVRLPDLAADERAGIYVVASRDGRMLRSLSNKIQRAPGACGSKLLRSDQHWLADLIKLVAEHNDRLEWRALHLYRTETGLDIL